MLKKYSSALLLLILLSTTNLSFAKNYFCTGTIGRIQIRFNSVIAVDFTSKQNFTGKFNDIGICALDEKFDADGNKNIISYMSPDSCKGILTLLTKAKESGQYVRLYFNNGDKDNDKGFDDAKKYCSLNNTYDSPKHMYTFMLL